MRSRDPGRTYDRRLHRELAAGHFVTVPERAGKPVIIFSELRPERIRLERAAAGNILSV